MKETHHPRTQMIATTLAGLEEVLAVELGDLGAHDIEILPRAVRFNGDKALMYQANLWCRTALRILKPIATFTVHDEKELYRQVMDIEWWTYLDIGQTFSIDAVVHQSTLTHSHYAEQKAKDAIADRFKSKYGRRPDVSTADPDVKLNLHLSRDVCTVSLDSSGVSLHRRGYRVRSGPASLNEVLAAGMIRLSAWDKDSCFIDPMCGSATLPIEAALIATNIAPGTFRKSFGFEKWNDFDISLWENLKKEAWQRQRHFGHPIIGSDISGSIIRGAAQNIANARLQDTISLENTDMTTLRPPCSHGIIITNPPYGERLGVADINSFYKKLGDAFKKNFTGFTAWMLTADKQALKHVGLRTTKKITLFNGPLECKFAKFELYKGSKKPKKDTYGKDQ
jgi:putative N6-adenine-specific DNA methylase